MAGQIPDDNKRVDWNTPGWVVEATKETFQGHIGLDPCSNPTSLVDAASRIQLPQNGLLLPWQGHGGVFINPPYGRCFLHKVTSELLDPKKWKDLSKGERDAYHDTSIEDWISKAYLTYDTYGTNFVMLVPAYVNAQYFQKYVFQKATAICFPNGRFKFEGAPSTAAFHVCLPFYGKGDALERFRSSFQKRGHAVCTL